jgi:hypothetical protein
MLQDKDKVGLYISPGKHGKIHYEKAMRAGKPFPVAMVFGQHPLLFIAASQAVPFGVNEYEWSGGLLNQPIEIMEGPLTGLRFPATAEIAIEGEIIPGESLPEGPFGSGRTRCPARGPLFRSKHSIIARSIICGARRLNRQFTVCIGRVCAQQRSGTEWSKPGFRISAEFISRHRRSGL